MFTFQTKATIDLINPKLVGGEFRKGNVPQRRNEQEIKREEKVTEQVVNYRIGEKVWYRTKIVHLAKWIPAIVLKRISKYIFFEIKLESGLIRKAHGAQLKKNVERVAIKYTLEPPNNRNRLHSESASPDHPLPIQTSRSERSPPCIVPMSERLRPRPRPKFIKYF